MINIHSLFECCGCEACVQICPQKCIRLEKLATDYFLYPRINKKDCVNCGQCNSTCPMLSQKNKTEIKKVFAARHPQWEIRKKSSSGGVFSQLARTVIERGGCVYGAAYDKNWNVVHKKVEELEDLQLLRGTKYVQSYIGDAYGRIKTDLRKGRLVMFSGTPCQALALRLFLKKEYKNLIILECVCHGVPAPQLWQKYLEELCLKLKRKKRDIVAIDFRDKRTGWKNYSFCVRFSDGTEFSQVHDNNLWIKGFVRNYYIRSSCFNCPAKSRYSMADLGLGDLWGIDRIAPEIDDDGGHNVVLVYTKRGEEEIQKAGVVMEKKFTMEKITKCNPSIMDTPSWNDRREDFFYAIKNGNGVIPTMEKEMKERVINQVWNTVRNKIHNLRKMLMNDR